MIALHELPALIERCLHVRGALCEPL
jgi:hypothetical protein